MNMRICGSYLLKEFVDEFVQSEKDERMDTQNLSAFTFILCAVHGTLQKVVQHFNKPANKKTVFQQQLKEEEQGRNKLTAYIARQATFCAQRKSACHLCSLQAPWPFACGNKATAPDRSKGSGRVERAK